MAINAWLWRKDRLRALTLLEASLQEIPKLQSAHQASKISFLIAAWNEIQTITRCLESVYRLPYPHLEIVVCAGGSDGTFRSAADFAALASGAGPQLIILEQLPGEGKQRALQRSYEASSGEIIYLIDADCLITSRTFFLCLVPILSGEETIVTGSFYFPLPEQQHKSFIVSQLANLAYPVASQPHFITGLLGGNCVITRSALEKAGAFRNSVRTGTDLDLAKRLTRQGERIRMVHSGWIQAEYPEKFPAYFRQQARWLRNSILLGLQYQSYAEVRSGLQTALLGSLLLFLPAFSFVSIVIHKPASGISLTLLGIWFSLFFYAYLSRLRYYHFARLWLAINSPRRYSLSLLYFTLVDFCAWFFALVQLFARTWREQW